MNALYDMVKKYVEEHKYNLVEEENDKLIFRYQLNHVHVWTYADDEHFMVLMISGFDDPVTADSLVNTLIRCHQLNCKVKQVKFFTMDDSVVASAELYIKSEEDFTFQLETALDNLVISKVQYQNEARKKKKKEEN